jgi:hypothetical protein
VQQLVAGCYKQGLDREVRGCFVGMDEAWTGGGAAGARYEWPYGMRANKLPRGMATACVSLVGMRVKPLPFPKRTGTASGQVARDMGRSCVSAMHVGNGTGVASEL